MRAVVSRDTTKANSCHFSPWCSFLCTGCAIFPLGDFRRTGNCSSCAVRTADKPALEQLLSCSYVHCVRCTRIVDSQQNSTNAPIPLWEILGELAIETCAQLTSRLEQLLQCSYVHCVRCARTPVLVRQQTNAITFSPLLGDF